MVEGSQTACVLVGPSRWRAARRGSRCDCAARAQEQCGSARHACLRSARRREHAIVRASTRDRTTSACDALARPQRPSSADHESSSAACLRCDRLRVDGACDDRSSRSRRSFRRATSGTRDDLVVDRRQRARPAARRRARRSARSCGARRPRAACACTSRSPARGRRRWCSRSRGRG